MWQRRVEEWAPGDVAEQSSAGNGGGRIELELVVVELGGKRGELVRGACDACLEREPGMGERVADQCRERVASLRGRFPQRERPNLGDHIRVAFARQPLDEIPAAPQCSDAARGGSKTAEEERQGEFGTKLDCCDGQPEYERRKAEVSPLVMTQLA